MAHRTSPGCLYVLSTSVGLPKDADKQRYLGYSKRGALLLFAFQHLRNIQNEFAPCKTKFPIRNSQCDPMNSSHNMTT